MPTALLLIDLQNDYFPGGKMELDRGLEAIERAGLVLSRFRAKGLPVVHIQHVSTRPGASFFLPGTEGAEIHEAVKPGSNEPVVVKHYPNAFRDTQLLEYLRGGGIEHLAIAGMMTHMCVDATTRAAFDHGFQCTVLHDSCATMSLSFGGDIVPARQVHAAFLAALGAVYANVTTTHDFLAGLG